MIPTAHKDSLKKIGIALLFLDVIFSAGISIVDGVVYYQLTIYLLIFYAIVIGIAWLRRNKV